MKKEKIDPSEEVRQEALVEWGRLKEELEKDLREIHIKMRVLSWCMIILGVIMVGMAFFWMDVRWMIALNASVGAYNIFRGINMLNRLKSLKRLTLDSVEA